MTVFKWNKMVIFRSDHKILLLLICIYLPCTVLTETMETCSTCIRVNTTCYNTSYVLDLEAQFRNKIVINEMHILRSDNVLFYSFEPSISNPEYYQVGFVNLNDPTKHGVLSAPNITLNFGTFDMDQGNSIIYLGGSDGVYKFDAKTSSLAHYSSHGDTIISLIFKGYVYFVRDREHEVTVKIGNEFDSVLKNDESKGIEHTRPKLAVKKFIINNDNVVVFLSSYGLYATKAAKNADVVMLSKNAFFKGFSMDLDGAIYTWWIDGIYKVVVGQDFHKSRVVKIADIPTIGALTFDNANNMLFTSGKSLFSLTKTDIVEC